jgi:hypothetical protein
VIGGDFNLSVSERHPSEERKNKKCNLEIQSRLRDELGLINCWQTMNPNTPLAQTLRWDDQSEPALSLRRDLRPSSVVGTADVMRGSVGAGMG